VYECLDIHRLLLGNGLPSRLLHWIESWALRGVDLVFVSAPAFRDAYFRNQLGYKGEVLLVENLVPRPSGQAPVAVAAPAAPPPWVIGWFGMLRCRRTLDMLKQIAAASDGRVEVLIAGRPSTDQFTGFEQEVADAPGVHFAGSYTAEDLPALFSRIHFIWAIDYFEEGLNSTWLLPNRLYESIAHGAVPLALRAVATGDWLADHGVGVLLDEPLRQVPALLDGLTSSAYQELREAVARVPAQAVTMDDTQAIAIANAITGIA
jgi:succinoglycan biosynthesis protein ExoL